MAPLLTAPSESSGILDKKSEAERAPYFELFLHCVVELMREHQPHYEFGEDLVGFILDQAYALRFGTFAFSKVRDVKVVISGWYQVNTRVLSLQVVLSQPMSAPVLCIQFEPLLLIGSQHLPFLQPSWRSVARKGPVLTDYLTQNRSQFVRPGYLPVNRLLIPVRYS